MRVGKKRRKMMNRVPLVGLVEIAMEQMNSGFAAISVRDGSMANV